MLRTARFRTAAAATALLLLPAVPAAANNFGESLAWQFMTPGDRCRKGARTLAPVAGYR